MSNIFQPLTRNTGGLLVLNIGTGPLVDPVKNQHLNLDSAGAIYAVIDGVIGISVRTPDGVNIIDIEDISLVAIVLPTNNP